MRRVGRRALVSVLTIGQASSAADRGSAADPARVLVKFRSGTALSVAAERAGSRGEVRAARAALLSSRIGLPLAAGAAFSPLAQVVLGSGVAAADLAARLEAEAEVEYAIPDERRRIVAAPRDPLYAEGVPGNGPAAGQWYLRAPTGDVASSSNVEPAWLVTPGRPDVVVAVVDTGVRYEHPDLLPVSLGGNLLPGYDMISEPEIANDGDGRDADASDPGDWVSQSELSSRGSLLFRCTTSAESSSWHGTQVSGLVAAVTDNGIGMAGTAPGVRVLPVRVLGKCGGYDSDIIAGMRWSAGLEVPGAPPNPYPARVINLSLGGEGSCSVAYQEAVAEILAAGTLIVAAAGNSSGHAVAAPANCTGVLAVAGLRHAGTKVGYSSLGSEVAISAPAGNCVNTASGSACLYPILTTSDSGTTGPAGSTYTDSYSTSLGTSFSAPLVSGVAALALSVRPDLTPPQVRELLQSTARPFPALGSVASSSTVSQCTAPQYNLMGRAVDQGECYCTTTTCGAGMLDAGAALEAASADPEASGRDTPR
jgi:serine protease